MRSVRLTLLLLAAALASAGPAPAAELSFDPDSTLVIKNDVFLVSVVVDAQDSIMGYDVTVSFDKGILVPLDVFEGDLPAGSGHSTFFRWLNEGDDDGTLRVNGSILGATIDGPGALFTIEFRALCAGVSALCMPHADLRDGLNRKLFPAVSCAEVTVTEPIATQESSWGAIKTAASDAVD